MEIQKKVKFVFNEEGALLEQGFNLNICNRKNPFY